MTATKQQVVKATLDFSIRVQVSVQATEAKWKKLTKDYVDPNEPWVDQADTAIRCFCEDELGPVLNEELETRLLADMPNDPVFGLKTTKPVIEWSELDDCELEVLE